MTTPALIAMDRNDGVDLLQWRAQRSRYAEVSSQSLDEQSQLIEQVIGFDTHGVLHLRVRVPGVEQDSRRASEQPLTLDAPIEP